MTKEGLEKEATEFEVNYTVYEVAKRKDGSDYAKKVCKVTVKEAYLAGAEPREKRIDELEQQIEKMKCGGNCKHLYHVNTGGCYDAKCDLTYCDCTNCKDEWELRS